MSCLPTDATNSLLELLGAHGLRLFCIGLGGFKLILTVRFNWARTD